MPRLVWCLLCQVAATDRRRAVALASFPFILSIPVCEPHKQGAIMVESAPEWMEVPVSA